MGHITVDFSARLNNLQKLQDAFNTSSHITQMYPLIKAAEVEAQALADDITRAIQIGVMHEQFIKCTLDKVTK